MQSINPQLDPGPILQTAFGFWSSKVLLTAVEFDVFTKLGNRRMTGAELGAELGLHSRGISDFFDALVAMQFLDRAGDGPSARYFNTPSGALYLDRGSPRYVGGWLVMTNGTIKISGTFTGTSRVFSAASYTIPATAGFWLNNPNYTVAGQNGSPTQSSMLRVSQGTFNIGTATGNSMGFNTGSTTIVEGGAVNATGRFAVAAAGNAITYTQTGGTITVCTIGNASATLGSFDLGTAVTSSISMTGGTIVTQLAATAIDYRAQSGGGPAGITGGTLQFGNAASGAAKTFNVRGVVPNVVVTNTSANHTANMSTHVHPPVGAERLSP